MIKGDLTKITSEEIPQFIKSKLGTLHIITLKEGLLLSEYRDTLIELLKTDTYSYRIAASAIAWAAEREREKKVAKIAPSAFKGVLGESSGGDDLITARKFLEKFWAYGANLPKAEDPNTSKKSPGLRVGDL